MAKDYWTTKHPNGWQVKGAGNNKATSVHSTQRSAWAESKDRARNAGGEAFLQGANGQIRERNTYGHDPRSSKG